MCEKLSSKYPYIGSAALHFVITCKYALRCALSSVSPARGPVLCALCLFVGAFAKGESVTYRIVEYNADAASFVLAPSGEQPKGSYAVFENEYGATAGNRYNQIPRNRQATLWLEGWQGCTIEGITLSMCSNKTSGTVGLNVSAGDLTLFAMPPADFADEAWFGRWVSKDIGVYVDIAKAMTSAAVVPADAPVAITLKAGTKEGSVYINALTIDYTPPAADATESALGWVYEKMEAKSTLADGDVVMLYRSGDAAGNIDGMETSHYLDAIGLNSTSDVQEPDVLLFTAHSTSDRHWTLTDQYGRRLGAARAQHLVWNEGVDTWDISLGYNGATIASTNTKYGTLRYNAPAGSYARFWNYTSNTLPLPYLYRRSCQREPVVSHTLVLPSYERTVNLSEQDTVALRPSLLPATTTDRRIRWQTSDESIAGVQSGIVSLRAVGDVTVTAISADGGSMATCLLHVQNSAEAISFIKDREGDASRNNVRSVSYDLSGRPAPSSAGICISNHAKLVIPNSSSSSSALRRPANGR